jgi:hypothetical protein
MGPVLLGQPSIEKERKKERKEEGKRIYKWTLDLISSLGTVVGGGALDNSHSDLDHCDRFGWLVDLVAPAQAASTRQWWEQVSGRLGVDNCGSQHPPLVTVGTVS